MNIFDFRNNKIFDSAQYNELIKQVAANKGNISDIYNRINNAQGSTGNQTGVAVSSSIRVIPKVIAEFNGTLDDMNKNEEYPSTKYFGTTFTGIKLIYGKDYLVEYNGESYKIRPRFTPFLSMLGSGMGMIAGASPTDFLTLGSTYMLDEYVARQNQDPPAEGEEEDEDVLSLLGPLLGIILAIALGRPVDFDSIDLTSYPFAFISFADFKDVIDEENEMDFDTLFLVNNSNPECNLKITEYDIEIENPLTEYLQPDYMQFNKKNPAYIKNKLIGIESTNKYFFNGQIKDLSLTAITDEEGETTGYFAPLNELPAGLSMMAGLFSGVLGSGISDGNASLTTASYILDTFFAKCIIVKINGVEQVIYPLSFKEYMELIMSLEDMVNNMTEEELAEFEAFMETLTGGVEDGFVYPFGNLSILYNGLPNTGENFCVLVSFKYAADEEESTEGEGNTGENTEETEKEFDSSLLIEALDSIFTLNATIYTNLTMALPEHEIVVEYADVKVLNRRYLPTMLESDLPDEALTYTASKSNAMLMDQENGYEYLVLCKNGQLETLCRCASIAITTNPNKLSYKVGDNFDPTGMVVTATRQDGSTEDVSSKVTCDYTTSTFSSTSTKEVTVTFKEAGHSYTAKVAVTVTE